MTHQKQQDEWHPIASIPRDGKLLQLRNEANDETCFAQWQVIGALDPSNCNNWSFKFQRQIQATHWRHCDRSDQWEVYSNVFEQMAHLSIPKTTTAQVAPEQPE